MMASIEEPRMFGAVIRQTEKGELIELRTFDGALVRRVYLYQDSMTAYDYWARTKSTRFGREIVTPMEKPDEGATTEASEARETRQRVEALLRGGEAEA